jgi:hypothetical protein
MSQKNKDVKRILNCIPSRGTERDWGVVTATGAGVLAARPAIPVSKDLREPWWEVADQGYTGSCVGWAAADSVIRWYFVQANRLAEDQRLSPRFIWMASKETDEFVSRPSTFIELAGTSLKGALDVARKLGVVLDSVLPFDSGKLYQGSEEVFYALAAQLRITSYFNLGTNLGNWRTWLATKGPILIRLDVDTTWYNAEATQGKLDTYQAPSEPAGHAVALVGYTPDRLIVRNSWGKDWGDKGFAYASFAYAQGAFTEAYGIAV